MNYEMPLEHLDQDEIYKQLLLPLERFLVNAEEPKEVLEKLSELNSPKAMCGKKFQNGDATYGCKDCGLDNSCVLCVDCFKASEHKHHKYAQSII